MMRRGKERKWFMLHLRKQKKRLVVKLKNTALTRACVSSGNNAKPKKKNVNGSAKKKPPNKRRSRRKSESLTKNSSGFKKKKTRPSGSKNPPLKEGTQRPPQLPQNENNSSTHSLRKTKKPQLKT